VKNLAHFLFEIGMLKRTPRSGFQFLGSGTQSVAEHSFRTAMIGYVLALTEENIDVGKVLELCLFHDVPEARIGDLNYVNKKYVSADEKKAVDDLAATLPFGERYRKLQYEFMDGDSAEAVVAHDADQLEMILSLKEYKDLGNPNADEWYPFSCKRLKTENGRKLAQTIWETNSTHWWFDDDADWWVHGEKKEDG